MQVISLLGIIVAIVIFSYLCYKGVNIFFNIILAVVIVILSGGADLFTTITNTYMTSVSGFLKSYLLLFVISSLYGKVLEDSGVVRRIALSLANLTRKSTKNQAFLTVLILPIFYYILSFVGISGFVVVFTVVAIGRELFEECNIPWWFYCYGSAGIVPAVLTASSLQPGNIIISRGFNVAPSAGFAASLVPLVVSWIALLVVLKLDINKYQKSGEGFLPTGAPIKALQMAAPRPESELPSLWISIIPLIIPAFCLIAFSNTPLGDPVTALVIAIIVSVALFYKKFNNISSTLSLGLTAGMVPVINVAAASGLVSVARAMPGFTIIINVLDGLPPLLSAMGFSLLIAAMVGSTSSGAPNLFPYVSDKLFSIGMSPTIGARLMTASVFTCMTPHCAGVVNAVSLTKLNYGKAALLYFKTTFIPGIFAVIVFAITISLGIFK